MNMAACLLFVARTERYATFDCDFFFVYCCSFLFFFFFFFFQAEDGIRDLTVTGVQTCALPICGDGRCRARAGLPRARQRSTRMACHSQRVRSPDRRDAATRRAEASRGADL